MIDRVDNDCVCNLCHTSMFLLTILINLHGNPMVVYGPVFILIERLNVCVKQNFYKGEQQGEYEPVVNHLNIGCFREAAGGADEHGDQHQQACQVHRDNGLKEKGFEVVCRVSYDIE